MAARKPASMLRSTRLPLPPRAASGIIASAIIVSIAPTAKPSAKRNQVREYFPDHRRVFDAGDQLDETSAFTTNISWLEGLLWPTTAISTVEFYVLWITAIHHTAERHPVNSLMALSTQFSPLANSRICLLLSIFQRRHTSPALGSSREHREFIVPDHFHNFANSTI
jgi:hypothetical protein